MSFSLHLETTGAYASTTMNDIANEEDENKKFRSFCVLGKVFQVCNSFSYSS